MCAAYVPFQIAAAAAAGFRIASHLSANAKMIVTETTYIFLGHWFAAEKIIIKSYNLMP